MWIKTEKVGIVNGYKCNRFFITLVSAECGSNLVIGAGEGFVVELCRVEAPAHADRILQYIFDAAGQRNSRIDMNKAIEKTRLAAGTDSPSDWMSNNPSSNEKAARTNAE